MRRYKYRKIYKWNPDTAYLAGLVASDGCLSNNRRHLNITSNDIEILEYVIKLLELNIKIGIKKNGFGGQGRYIQFSDVALYDFLLKAGITPSKSKTILKVELPNELYRDFLRGVFDGDGTVYGYWDRRWRSSFMYYTEFTSASYDFLVWMHLTNKKLIGVRGGKIKPGIRAMKLSYAKLDSQKLFNFIYYAADLPALTRKREKFIKFLETDIDVKKIRASGGTVDAPA